MKIKCNLLRLESDIFIDEFKILKDKEGNPTIFRRFYIVPHTPEGLALIEEVKLSNKKEM